MIFTAEDYIKQKNKEFRFETNCRRSEKCVACGKAKSIGSALCWHCYKERKNAWKDSNLPLIAWIIQIKVESKNIIQPKLNHERC